MARWRIVGKTAKRWKWWELFGIGLVVDGCLGLMLERTTDGTQIVASALFFGGIALLVGAWAFAWWHHG